MTSPAPHNQHDSPRHGSRVPDPEFWQGRRVLLTGHTGFKGSWLAWWLTRLGSTVRGVSLSQPVSTPSLWEELHLVPFDDVRADVAAGDWLAGARAFRPDVVMHLAAQPLVSVGYESPGETFRANVIGTANVMELADDLPDLGAALIITTDKVYDTRQDTPFGEGAFLGGKDPYSASKAAAELVVGSWPTSAPVATARAGNVIGGGDWAAERLIPDMVRAWSGDREVVLRMPLAVRPWQHVLEPLAGYLVYVEDLVRGTGVPSSLNFGPDQEQAVEVGVVVEFAADQWRQLVPGSTPRWRVEGRPAMRETGVLTLDSTLAGDALGWRGVWGWRDAVARSIRWYVAALQGESPQDLVSADIVDYERGARVT